MRQASRAKVRTILVPLDGSALAETALPKALELAQASGTRVLLLRAAQSQTFPGIDPTGGQVKVVSEAETYLAEIQKRLAR
jgi:nucleotide-binding universal stress UspA family protein